MNKKEKIGSLTDAELEIMHVLWDSEKPLRASELTKKLSESRPWKVQTVHVLLSRLDEKGFIEADRSGYFHTYKARIGEAEYFASASGELFSNVGGSFKTLIASIIDTNDISDDELFDLKQMIDKRCAEIKKRGIK